MDKNQQREKLEKKITKTFSELFLLKEENKTASEEFSSLKTKLAENIWKWAACIFEKYENAGQEIMECVNLSINSFKGSPDKYLAYIYVSLKNEIRRANEKQKAFESSQMKFPEKKQQVLNHMIRWAEQYGKNIYDPQTQEGLAVLFNTEADKINRLLYLRERTVTLKEKTIIEDGEEFSLLETKSVSEEKGYGNLDFTFFEKTESLLEIIKNINDTFENTQERTKPYLSALVTRQLLFEAENANLEIKTILNLIENKTFTKYTEAKKIIECFEKDALPTQEEVARWFGRDKTDASRSIKTFVNKLSSI